MPLLFVRSEEKCSELNSALSHVFHQESKNQRIDSKKGEGQISKPREDSCYKKLF